VNHCLAFALCLAGFVMLAFSMDRQQRDLIGRALRKSITRVQRILGTCALLLALAALVIWQGWGLGLVMFSGHTSLAAGIIYCGLIGMRRRGLKRRPWKLPLPAHW
jgi:O-antigen/teichoic acid export membrane protein